MIRDVEDEAQLSSFDLYRWQRFPVSLAAEQPLLPPATRARATGRARACVVHCTMVYDEGYVLYAYRWQGTELGFAYPTGFDEVHRVWSLDERRPHDVLEQGFAFDVQVDPRRPRSHVAVGLPFLSSGVHWLDPALE